MSGSVNKVILIGNVGRDPEIRSMNSGDKVCNFTLATSEKWKDKTSGEQKESTEWHRVVVWDQRLVDLCEKYVQKGSRLYLEGQLQTRKWTDQSGVEKYSTEVVLQRFRGVITLLGDKPQQSATAAPVDTSAQQPGPTGAPGQPEQTAGGVSAALDDEIPFAPDRNV